MQREKFFDLLGYIGIGLIQGATMPSLVNRLVTGDGPLPPASMTIMLWAGLLLFLARSIERKDMVAIVSNTIGWALQSIMLALLFLPIF